MNTAVRDAIFGLGSFIRYVAFGDGQRVETAQRKAACSRVLASAVGSPGDWRMDRTVANGQPAVAAYLREQPFGVAVLDVRRDGIAGVTVFNDPALVATFRPT